ncbi:MAG: ATP-binding protein [Thiohalomonadales bacterium]
MIPNFFFSEHPDYVVIDEAQEYPEIFKILRGVIDSNRSKNGRFIITGSSSPALINNVSETLAGRIAIVELGTLKCNELYELPLSPFYFLFESPLSRSHVKELLGQGLPPLIRKQVHHSWFYGGYPEPMLGNNAERHAVWMKNYRDTYLNRDVAKLFPKLNRQAYRRFVTMLCKLSGTLINKSQVGRAVEASESTIRDYMEIADGTYIWRTVNSYESSVAKSITKMPKGYMRDSGFLHYLLGIVSLEGLMENPVVGTSFEGYVCEELAKGLEATNVTNWNINYFRTRGGAEIDLIIDGSFGLLPVEVKYGSTVKRNSLKSLTAFIKDNKLPMGMIINQSERVEWVTQDIVQIPVGWL